MSQICDIITFEKKNENLDGSKNEESDGGSNAADSKREVNSVNGVVCLPREKTKEDVGEQGYQAKQAKSKECHHTCNNLIVKLFNLYENKNLLQTFITNQCKR